MNKRRKPFNYFKIISLVLMIAFVMYFGVVLVPNVQSTFLPTPTPTRSPESFVTEAGQLFEQGKLPQAIQAYQQAVRAMPNDATIYISLARVQVWAGKYKEAQTSAENALLLNNNNSMAHAVRGWALEAQRDFLTASTAIDKAIELDSKNALAHAYKAELLADQYLEGTGTLDVVAKMSDESNTALALGPDLLETHRARGYVLEATGNNDEAILQYNQAIAINKNIADVQVSLGRCYRALAVYDKAVDAFTSANQLNPSDPTPLLYISRVYETVGSYPKAEQYAQQAVKTNPTDALLRGNLGVMYYRNSKWPLAADELSLVVNGGKDQDGVEVAAIKLSPDASRVIQYFFTYGIVLAKLNRCGEALPLFQQILSTVLPNDEIARYNANEGIRICAELVGATASPASGTPGASTLGTPSFSLTGTPTP